MAGSYYLMSACQTADEFVAAFRRYAEKTMLFVPTQTPLPNGTRARLAVTLADGSVMIEGDAEVVGSTTRAVGLHARPGMSVRFHDLDDTSRQVIDQLVRARLMSRPVPLPTHLRPRPRAGTVPEPSPELQAERKRATSTVTGMAPVPSVNAEALPAECTLVEVPPAGVAAAAIAPPPSRADLEGKFDYSAPAPRDVDVPVEATSRAPARPLTMKGPGPGRIPGGVPLPNTLGVANAVPTRASEQLTVPELAPPASMDVDEISADFDAALEPALPSGAKTMPMPAEVPHDEPTATGPPPEPMIEPAIDPMIERSIEPAPPRVPEATSTTRPATVEPADARDPDTATMPASARESAAASEPPVPAPPRLPATPRGRQSMSKTMIGVAPVLRAPGPPAPPAPSGANAPPAPTPPASAEPAPGAPIQSEVFGAWWPDGVPPPAHDNHDTQPMEPMFPVAPSPSAGGIGPWQGGDPAKLPPPPHEMSPTPPAPLTPAFGEPAHSPPGAYPQPSPEPGPPPTFDDGTDLLGKRRPNRMVLVAIGGAILLAIIVIVIATGGGSKPDAAAASGSGTASAASPTASSTIDAAPALAASPDAATAVAVAPSPDAATTSVSPPPPASIDAGAPPGPPIGAGAAGACKASFTSTPSGADVVIAGKIAGTTPATLPLPCAAATATIRRARYQSKDVSFTPTADGATVATRLDRPSFVVKIYSTPSGATVTIGGKVLGRTPLSTKQPGFETEQVSFKKDGYATATAKLYAKASGAIVKATLHKAAGVHH